MSTLSIDLVPGALPADGEQITNETLRSIARPTVQLNGSVGTATVDDGAITTAKLADGALSADATGRAKMADGFTTAAKLASDAVTTAKILDEAVTAAKLAEAAQQSVHQYAAGALTTGVYAITLSPAATAYTAGMVVRFKADLVNTGATDLNVNSLGAKNLFTLDGKELVAGQLRAGALIEAVYDGTQFICNLRSRYSLAVASGVSIPSVGATATLAHGLGAEPFVYRVFLVCTTNDAATGYVTTDPPIPVEFANSTSNERAFLTYADANNISVVRNNNTAITLLHKTTGNTTAVTSSGNWKLIARAEL